MKRLKVVIATPLYPPDPGGPATYASLLVELLPREEMDTVLVKFSDVRHLPKFLRHIAYAWNVFRFARSSDLVLALDPVSTGVPSALASWFARKPYVVKIVGDYAWEQGRQRFGITATLDEFLLTKRVPLAVRFLRFLQKTVALHARAVIVPSTYLEGVVRSWGIPEWKFVVIYNAMRMPSPGAVPPEVATLPHPRIVSVGRLVPWKHMEGVIDAGALLPNASLIIVGEGPERERLVAYAQKVHPKTVFTGALSHADTLAVMMEAKVFVLNSSYEGFSHLLVEAVSLGVPVVATAVGGNAEIVTSSADGVLVQAGDTVALTHAIQKALKTSTRTKPERAIVRFSPKTMVQKTATLFRTLV